MPNCFRRIAKLRKENPVLIYGQNALLDKENKSVYAYTRQLEDRKILVLLNFKAEQATAKLDFDLSGAKILAGNYAKPSIDRNLQPYEAIVCEI